MIDNMLKQLSEKGLSVSTCRYAQRILSVAFEAARNTDILREIRQGIF